MTQNILVQFDSDTSGIAEGAQALTALSAKEKELVATFEKGVTQTNTALKTFADNVKNVDKASVGAFGTKGLQEFQKVVQTGASEIKVLDSALKLAKKNLDNFKPDSKEFKVLNQEIAKGEALMKALGVISQGTNKEFKNFRSELNATRSAMQELEEAGLETSDAFQQLAARAGQVQDQIGDTQQRIKALSSDTAGLDAVVEGVQGVAGAFQFASGVTALFGNENKEVQEALVKLNGIMAITQSLQQAQNFLRGQSILRLRAEALGNSILAASTRLTAAAYGGLGVAVTATSTAFKVLRAAIITTGIGAVVVAIGFLIEKLSSLTSTTKDASEAQKALNENLEQANDAALQAGLAFLGREEQIEEARARNRGASEAQILAITEKYARLRNEQREKYLKNSGNQYKIEEDIANENTKLEVDRLDFSTDANKKAHDKKIADDKKAASVRKDLAQRNATALFEIEQRRLKQEADSFKEGSDSPGLLFNMRFEALNNFAKKQAELLDLQRRNELSKDGLTSVERLNIEKNYTAELLNLQSDVKAKRQGIEQSYTEFLRSNKEAQAEEDKRQFAALEENAKSGGDFWFNVMIEQADARMRAADKVRADDLVKEKAHQEAKAKITQAAYQVVSNIAQIFAQSSQANVDEEIQQITQLKDHKIITAEEADKRIRTIRRKAAADEKKMAIFSALLSQSQAVLAVLADKTIPAIIKPFVIAATIASSLSQLALIISRPLPAFKTGVIGLQGPGTETSDSIIARLSKNESVIKASMTRKWKPALTAINENRFESYIANIKMPEMNYGNFSMARVPSGWNSGNSAPALDYEKLGQSVARHVGKVSDISQLDVNIDKTGIHVIAKEGSDRTEYLNNKYRFKL
ncbi:hypothetical protein [Segetibacter aerophilus]|uniref:Uncharacterized protein n=1 Tax=Segetibacter aerophilus TaxID=670293 RepID=A0A512BA99_9BACT|nr:hypothetical protein [Segetibacter aerophilus]GEO08757.1 hypothetical protein SAE01_12530 [Segetibacter aerophilus]